MTGDISSAILYEDNHLLIINKRPSQIVQGDKTGDLSLVDLIKSFIKKRDSKPGNVFLGLVHRIDRPVSGTVIFTKTAKSLTRMNLMLKNGEIRKTYWAVVKNCPVPEKGILVHYLKKNEEKNKSAAYDKPVGDAKRAELSYEVTAKSDTYFLVEIQLHTGRHHQIRSQLSKIGSPIKGDLKYGYDRSNSDGSIHLHARSVEFIHPVRKENIIVVAPPPADKIWDFFSAMKKEKK